MDVVTVDYGKTFHKVCDEGKQGCKHTKKKNHFSLHKCFIIALLRFLNFFFIFIFLAVVDSGCGKKKVLDEQYVGYLKRDPIDESVSSPPHRSTGHLSTTQFGSIAF